MDDSHEPRVCHVVLLMNTGQMLLLLNNHTHIRGLYGDVAMEPSVEINLCV